MTQPKPHLANRTPTLERILNDLIFYCRSRNVYVAEELKFKDEVTGEWWPGQAVVIAVCAAPDRTERIIQAVEEILSSDEEAS